MTPTPRTIIELLLALHPLDRVPRAGYLLRGVTEPESVAAHSHGLALLVCLVAPTMSPAVNELDATRMALVHDVTESSTMDIPMTVGGTAFRESKTAVENEAFDRLFAAQRDEWRRLFRDFQESATPESRLVRGLDKVQMMVKVLGYEREGRGRLEDFWLNPNNFKDYGITVVKDLFDEIFLMAGRTRPGKGTP